MVNLISLLETTEDANRLLNGRWLNKNRLETTLQTRVLLDVLAELVESGGADQS